MIKKTFARGSICLAGENGGNGNAHVYLDISAWKLYIKRYATDSENHDRRSSLPYNSKGQPERGYIFSDEDRKRYLECLKAYSGKYGLKPSRPTNSPKAVYQIELSALKLLMEFARRIGINLQQS